jgi:hypothetical protein
MCCCLCCCHCCCCYQQACRHAASRLLSLRQAGRNLLAQQCSSHGHVSAWRPRYFSSGAQRGVASTRCSCLQDTRHSIGCAAFSIVGVCTAEMSSTYNQSNMQLYALLCDAFVICQLSASAAHPQHPAQPDVCTLAVHFNTNTLIHQHVHTQHHTLPLYTSPNVSLSTVCRHRHRDPVAPAPQSSALPSSRAAPQYGWRAGLGLLRA